MKGRLAVMLVSVDSKKRVYEVIESGRGTKPRVLSFDYVHLKSEKLHEWLLAQNEYWDRPAAEYIGTERAYRYMRDITERVETLCAVRGIECYALLHPQLIGLEGCKVLIDTGKGQNVKYVSMQGKYIKYHVLLRTADAMSGGRAKGVYNSVTVIT